MTMILNKIHNMAFIHNDIKPNNIFWEIFNKSDFIEKNHFFLINFGYSRKIGILINDKNKILKNWGNNILHYEERIDY